MRGVWGLLSSLRSSPDEFTVVNDDERPGCEKLFEALCAPGGDDRLDDGLVRPAWNKTSVNEVNRLHCQFLQ
ncbi:hypothetical protein K443DRAFT_676587 [Laccaria amethystina LaAM-08-1]|uniref:Uncharacterized protein n=1 Tax=Laccaria amethystina LaAM-08-1 TaxID=1095629 RepID=A0A0C9XFB7_9AGAR|nr:hypothetical protein K443DRAFT_676587 [Laccaria amethystina LaAM-08-1]